jgi:hypothetical protein
MIDVSEWVARTRARAGKPRYIEDQAVLAKVGSMLRAIPPSTSSAAAAAGEHVPGNANAPRRGVLVPGGADRSTRGDELHVDRNIAARHA